MQTKLFKARDHLVSDFLQVKLASSREDTSHLSIHRLVFA